MVDYRSSFHKAAASFIDQSDDTEYRDTVHPIGASEDLGTEMSDAEFSASVKSSVDDAVDYIDGFIAPARALATQYYRGDLFGNEEEGRSQIVMTEVRDTVQAIIPSLLRIFTASEDIVEFAPRNAQSVDLAAQQTDYINYIFYNDNPGFAILHGAFKDALVRKTGIIKWRWSEDTEISEAEYTDLSHAQVSLLTQDPDVEIVELEEKTEQEAVIDPASGMTISPAQTSYNIRIRRKIPRNKVVIESVPPEEFLIAREARDLDNAAYVGHRSLKTMSELIAMGYKKEDIEKYASQGDVFSINYEAQTRNPAIMSFMMHADNPDPSMRRVLYVESYVRIDKDGDGIAELRKVCSIGNSHHILHDEIATDVPFAFFCPDPEPHMIIGQSIADQTMDLQQIKSSIVRNTMDSLAQVIHPRTVVVEGQVNMDDVMNNETGAIIRARSVGAVQPLAEPFVGQAAMPLIAYMDQIRAQRTGISDASQGLNPDVLQSTTKAAVTATVQGAQERIELIARLFAENGMKRLFKGLLKMVVRHQDRPRTIKLSGKWVEVDPRYWDADLDVQVNVGLGHGTDSDKMAFLMQIASKQEQIMQILGPANPLADASKYRNTLAQICTLAGFKDASRYFGDVDPQQMQQVMSQNQNKPDPTTMLAQVEAQKTQASIVRENMKVQADVEDSLRVDRRERERMHMDNMVKLAEIEAKYGNIENVKRIESSIFAEQELLKAQLSAETDRHNAIIQALSQQQQAQQQQQPQGMTPNA
ncbi:hypothetical protein UFOVP155_42 [uncultured Caudovirales phage]|uniref:Uncharacterized protein n=1 Tax=uncultured Caudovirales phage TaxID=2100421 RepID=A0A6J7WCT7_9CAUD|nr:hypothetical protein UFOVP155_42 [uncultured Caudovirales phage]